MPRTWIAVLAGFLVALGGLSPSAQAETSLQPAVTDITLHVQPADGYRPIIDFIRSAKVSLDYNIYQFNN